jgi:hypothetical protein
MTSCSLAPDLDSYEPLYSLPAEQAISNESSAELALAGTYKVLRDNVYYSILPSMLSGTDEGSFVVQTGQATTEQLGFLNNSPVTDGTQLLSVYTTLYTMINRANWIIEKVPALSDNVFPTPNRKKEIVAEAKMLRALANFSLLRSFGQFYDLSSPYGIVIRLAPAKGKEVLPRSTVQQSYEAIIADLDSGIAEGPEGKAKFYVSRIFAKGLKAKVMLYMGDYTQAASLAADVINNSGTNYKLIPNYADLFVQLTPSAFNNTESLLNVYSDTDEQLTLGFYWNGYFSSLSNTFANKATQEPVTIGGQSILYDSTRIPFILTGAPLIDGFGNGDMKFKQILTGVGEETLYILRMSEMYLIYAEADARSKSLVSPQALKALNDVRVRAGATTTGGNGFETYPSSITYAQFLEVLRMEKSIELATETGEEWFDLVRYDHADGFGTGFQVKDIKPTAINSDKFVLPIPYSSIQQGAGVIKQNPSY